MQANLDALKITFPAVYESENRTEKQNTMHYTYRRSTGDTRNWGSPWYIFLTPATIQQAGDILTKRSFIINGEMIESEGEKFIREKLGLEKGKAGLAKKSEIEACKPDKAIAISKP
jgi:hypothetical protein